MECCKISEKVQSGITFVDVKSYYRTCLFWTIKE